MLEKSLDTRITNTDDRGKFKANIKKALLKQTLRCSITALPSPEKGQIYNRCEGIDKLQDEGFENEPLFKALVSLWNL